MGKKNEDNRYQLTVRVLEMGKKVADRYEIRQVARSGQFPKEEHAYKMVEGELPMLNKLMENSE